MENRSARRPRARRSNVPEEQLRTERGNHAGHPVLALQQKVGNQAAQRVLMGAQSLGPVPRRPGLDDADGSVGAVQRFSVPRDYTFTAQGRAAVPPSIGAVAVDPKERHHVIADTAILAFLEAQKRPDQAATPETVPVEANRWALKAIDAELARLGQLERGEVVGPSESKIQQAVAFKGDYQNLKNQFTDLTNNAVPNLGTDAIDNLLSVLEWMPSNFVIGRKDRSSDPGNQLDVEALVRHPDRETKLLLAKLAIKIGHIDGATLGRLESELPEGEKKQKWRELVAAALASDESAEDLFVQVAERGPGGEKPMLKSTTGQKQKLNSESWYALLKKVIVT